MTDNELKGIHHAFAVDSKSKLALEEDEEA
jgi:hypothetical protein